MLREIGSYIFVMDTVVIFKNVFFKNRDFPGKDRKRMIIEFRKRLGYPYGRW